jgi:hypothetical protein
MDFKISDRAIENLLLGESDPQLEILRHIAEDRDLAPAIRYLAACCFKFQKDAYNYERNEIHVWEMKEYE